MVVAIDRMTEFLERMTPDVKDGLFYGCDVKQLDIDISPKGIITGYLTVFDWSDTGLPYEDPYKDIVTRGMFDASYKSLDRVRRARGDEYLCPSLYNHDMHQMVGGMTDLSQDSKGYIYTSKLAMKLPRAQEVYELAKHRMIYASYGYNATLVSKQGTRRILKAVDLHEQSYVTFPANALASVISTKHAFTSYPSTKSNDSWARLAPPADMRIQVLESRWNALDPDIYSEEDDEEYTIGDLLKSVHTSIEKG